MKNTKKNMNIGAAFFFIFFSLLFFVLIIRFVTIQYTGEAEGKVLSAKAAQLYLRQEKIPAKRGAIYDHTGEVIAEDSASYTLVAILDKDLTTDPEHPRHVVDPQMTASKLANEIDMSEKELYERLTKEARKQVEFGVAGKDLSHSVKKKIESLKLPGISFIKESKRFYPNGIFSSHLIGYAQKEVNKKNKTSEIVGQTGLEKSYNDLLKGTDGSIQYEGDIWNYIIPNKSKHVIEPVNGHEIYLTLDKKIQTFLEDAMNKVDKQYKPKRIMAVVADPKTGKVLAMGQRPTYHPTTRVGIDKSWHNEIIETSFEPGSTMKIFSLAAAIEKKAFNPNGTFPSGRYYVNKSDYIGDHNGGRGWGPITYLEGVQRSSNVGFAYLLEKMGTEAWREYMDKFKFGTPTGIDLPNEVPGKILYDWPIEKVTSVFGQGTTVTAMQMVQAMTAIANDGKMMKPYVVEKIVNPNDGTEEKTKPEIVGQPISKETANEVGSILETVLTSEHGTGGRYKIDGYKVAGKTGTAQIPGPDGKYLKGYDDYVFSFLGMAPADDPKLIMYVAVEQPNLKEDENGNLENGSVPVSMIFNTVMKSSLQYLNIQPEEIPDTKIASLPDFSKMKTNEAIDYVKDNALVPIIIGEGEKIIDQSPNAGVSLIEGEKIVLKTDGNLTLPNMTGWSKRDVLTVAKLANLNVNIVGDGFAAKQNIKADTPIGEGDHLVVNFETPKQKIDREKSEKNKEDEDKPLN
ncbi:PASTA domain-containing protein [Bacillus sp. FJAT-49711]|uniref:penicillin-binding transpeptidase domain-containing protein n=1 Tax=Bacillus sp. FJAT-49711 TaxID=2833585 RepID=UPI001BC8D3DC|nr:penicillin-binding transpeptidase domain-containing protein [Bacillus sp. FJAT-49711]MBS4217845.1 PASTA domain-containing protein [Bacillus sp. FJAT-49711]